MSRHLLSTAAVVAASIFSLQTLAAAPTVTPSSGGISQPVTLTSFGGALVKKPKVELVPHAGQAGLKPSNLKVVNFSAAQIGAQVTSGLAGVYDVIVTPKDRGAVPVTLPDTFTILVPAPASVDPTSGAGNATVTIHGSRFGDAKSKVTIGGAKAKVKSWTADTIVVLVPKHAPSGPQPVVVTNKAGSSDGTLLFTATGGSSGGGTADEFLRADLSGRGHFDATNANPKGFSVTYSPQNGEQLTFAGTTQPTKGYPDLVISILPLNVARVTPYDIGTVPILPAFTIATLTYSEIKPPSVKIFLASAGNPGSDLKITITGWDGTFLEGTFTGTVVDGTGGSAPPIVVTNGQFRTRRATEP